jgi:hypothetical protein
VGGREVSNGKKTVLWAGKKKSSKTKTEIRAEKWKETKVNLPTTVVSTGQEKKSH